LAITLHFRRLCRITRSNTSESSTITYQGSTTLTFGGTNPELADENRHSFDVKFQFSKDATFDTMPHFHVEKTEYIFVERGTVRLTTNGTSRMIDSSAGEIEIPRWMPHRWEVLGGEETVVLERTVPPDGRKEAFFRNFVCLINDYGAMPPVLQVFKIFAEWDNYPIGEATWMSHAKTPIVGLTKAVGWVAGVVGYRAMYKEYTPQDLYERLQ
jgi:hypothetical protein